MSLTLISWLSFVSLALAFQTRLYNPETHSRQECSPADWKGLSSLTRTPFRSCPAAFKPHSVTYGPWTEEPFCIETLDNTDAYCVFTSSTFARGRGISILTTPSLAEHIANNITAFTQPAILDGVNELSHPPFAPQELAGRGIGLIMNSTAHRGDLLFAHTPILVVHRKAFQAIDADYRLAFQSSAIDLLPKHAQDQYFALHAHLDGDRVERILHTNSFQVRLGEHGEYHNIVLPETSRMNHDCRPNAHYFFDENTFTHYVHAIRTINTGEELTITYTDVLQSRAIRQAAIMGSWGFNCTCSLCSQSEMLTDESDRRLELISDLEKHLDDWSNETKATPEMAEANISLYQQERLHAPIALAYVYAALAYSAVGQMYSALKYASLAVESGLLNWGPSDDEVNFMQQLMNDPKAHWSWEYRKRYLVADDGDPASM